MKKIKGKINKELARQVCTSIFLIFHFSFFILFTSCREVPTYEVIPAKGDTLKENMINANRIIAQSEEQQIASWVTRRGLEMKCLLGGVRVMETESTNAVFIDYEDTVVLRYRMLTLGGQEVYSWRMDTVVAGHLKPTRGLDAALRTLHRGSRAMVVVPSEQAYGVVGDGDHINSRMVLVYEVEIEN